MSPGGERLKDEGTRTQVVIAGGIAGLVSRYSPSLLIISAITAK